MRFARASRTIGKRRDGGAVGPPGVVGPGGAPVIGGRGFGFGEA